MAEESTATTLILIGAIFQIIIALLFLIGGLGSSIGTGMGFLFGGISAPFDWVWVLVPGVPLMVFGILGLLFGALWLRWRHNPKENKQKLVMTGIIGLLVIGVIPGLIVLIAGAIIPLHNA